MKSIAAEIATNALLIVIIGVPFPSFEVRRLDGALLCQYRERSDRIGVT
jgi:hypothetical protein